MPTKGEKIGMFFFPSVEGSMTSSDGSTFLLHVRTEEEGELMLGFPHRELNNIVEAAAMQSGEGKDRAGDKIVTAFRASGFEVGRGPLGEPILTLTVGEKGRISFLLKPDMPGQLCDGLRKLAN